MFWCLQNTFIVCQKYSKRNREMICLMVETITFIYFQGSINATEDIWFWKWWSSNDALNNTQFYLVMLQNFRIWLQSHMKKVSVIWYYLQCTSKTAKYCIQQQNDNSLIRILVILFRNTKLNTFLSNHSFWKRGRIPLS